MKKVTLMFLAVVLMSGFTKLKADEGMWLPMFIERLNYVDMQKLGLQLTAEEIYSVNNASMKDAIVGLAESPNPSGFFCTGEIVSSEGLMFTNHHCGYDAINQHSTVANNYLEDGFWAMSRAEELPNEGMTASILVRMEDITDSILLNVSDTLTGQARTAEIRKITSRIKKAASEDGKYNPVVKSFFDDNEYYMFVYIVYKDVRLVGAPPSSIGKFGGDTDNWMWPRHTGDFSIFRIYTAPDGSPAEYAKENVPLVPKHYLPVSLDGVEKGDFAMIWGFPGSTERYTVSSGVQFKLDNYYPALIESFGEKLRIWKEHMDADEQVDIDYATTYATTANTWKYMIGQDKGVRDLNVVGEKALYELELTEWINADPKRKEKYGHVLTDMQEVYDYRADYIAPLIYASLCGIGGADIIGFASDFSGLQGMMQQLKEEKDKENKEKKENQIAEAAQDMKIATLEHFETYDEFTDRDIFAAMSEIYFNHMPDTLIPEVMVKDVAKFKGDFVAYANYIFDKSMFGSEEKTIAFLDKPELKTIDKDPAYVLMQGFMEVAMKLRGYYTKDSDKLEAAKKLFVQAAREMQPDVSFYPDANSTLRFSYGQVLDYYPMDAVHYDYMTYMGGIMEKEDPENDEFFVEEKLKELYYTQDFGPYGTESGKMPVCFLTNNDITGGNSGSPVVNAYGQLIGLAFDGNWEAMSSDIAFADDLQRTIVVDVRYVLFIIDKFAGASHLVDELTIIQTMPEPNRIEIIETPVLEEASAN